MPINLISPAPRAVAPLPYDRRAPNKARDRSRTLSQPPTAPADPPNSPGAAETTQADSAPDDLDDLYDQRSW